MNALARVWSRNNPGKPLPVEYLPIVLPKLPDIEDGVEGTVADYYGGRKIEPRTVEVVYAELEGNDRELKRTIAWAHDLVKNDGLLRAELADLIAVGKAASQANIKALEDLELRAGVKATSAETAAVEGTA